jgi:hypothetical protein
MGEKIGFGAIGMLCPDARCHRLVPRAAGLCQRLSELRQLLLNRGGGSRDVLGIAMALRAARLQQVLAGSGSGGARAARTALARA